MHELQPRQTFFQPAVDPQQETQLRLPGGQTVPYYYSLSSRSTVPYVMLEGGSYSNKVISWGEKVMVPPGELVTIKNASYHRGDIAINSGRDSTEMPTRVTVPVPFKTRLTDPRTVYELAFPLDCRRAKRAYGVIAQLFDIDIEIHILGTWVESSFTTGITPSGINPGSATYDEIVTIPANTKFGMFPLGLRPANDIMPMCLPDTAIFNFSAAAVNQTPGDTVNTDLAFYVLEY